MRPITSMRTLGGLLALTAILAGPPTAFWTFRDVLFPSNVHSFGDALTLLVTRDSGQVFLTLLAFAGIVAWLQLSVAVFIEAAGCLRRHPVRRIAGLGWARKIVAGVLLLMIGTATVATAAPSPAASPTHAGYVVRPGDSLMRIAAEQLGDERRYTEIYDLNHARRQPDGETLRDVALIKPGWHLDLPAKTTTDAYVVQPGDTLTSIARDRLGNANRYTEILPLNNNVHSPDRIRAGDTLHLPTMPPAIPAPRPSPPQLHAPPTSTSNPAPQPPTKQEHPTRQDPPSPAETINVPLVIAGAAGLAVSTVLGAVGVRRFWSARRHDPAVAETTLTADPIRNLDLALRQLARNAERQGSKLPEIRLIRLGREHTTLFLDRPGEPIAPFTATTISAEWQLLDPVQQEDHDGRDAPYPFLAGLGHESDGTLILLSLDCVGALLLDGDPEDVAQVGSAIALELASSPWAEQIAIDLVGAEASFAGIGHHESVDNLLARLGDAADRRPRIVIVPKPLAQEDADRLATSDVAADIVAVVAGVHPDTDIPGAWELDLRQSPTPVEQLDVSIALQRLPQGETEDLAEPSAPDPIESLVRTPRGERDKAETLTETRLEEAIPELRLLGPVSLRGVDYTRVEGKKVNRLTELAAFLALNPGAHADRISEQLGTPSRPWSAATRQGYISRLRTWLGHTPDGELYVPNVDAKHGGYRLDALPCDWFRFQSLVKAATSDDRIGKLQEALDLVNGTPLTDVPRGRYEWSSWHQRDMIDQIVEVAHTLATTYYEAGDLTRARRAAVRGLCAEPVSELLSRDLLRIEQAAGNHSSVRAIADKVEASSSLLQNPLDIETVELLRQAVQ